MRRSASLFFLFAALCGAFLLSSCTNKNEIVKLSELEDEALIQYIEDNGISIPNGIEISSIREMVADLEADPDCPPMMFSWAEVNIFYEKLRAMVKWYYSVAP